MIPIVFPHTYLSSRLMLLLPAVFSRIGVYLPSDLNIPIPMQRWVDSGLVELRVPVSADKQRLAAVLKAFGSWASMQSGQPGIDIDLLKAYHSQKPFFDAPFASQIRTDIHRGMTPASSDKNGKAAEAESLFNARVFLSIAQQLDEQADTLDRDYAAVDQRQQDLMRALHADDPPALSTPGNRGALRAGGQGQYMLAQRLRAWAQLAAADPALTGANAPALFVTGSREVLQGVVEQLPPDAAFDRSSGLRVPLEESDPLRDWRRAFSQALAALTGVRLEHQGPAQPVPQHYEQFRCFHPADSHLPLGGASTLF